MKCVIHFQVKDEKLRVELLSLLKKCSFFFLSVTLTKYILDKDTKCILK